MLAVEGEDEERFFDIIDKKIQDSSIESYPKYIKFKEAHSKKNSKVSKGKARDKDKDKDRSSGKNKKRKSEKSSEEDLIALIQQRNKERNDHLKDMELRYSK